MDGRGHTGGCALRQALVGKEVAEGRGTAVSELIRRPRTLLSGAPDRVFTDRHLLVTDESGMSRVLWQGIAISGRRSGVEELGRNRKGGGMKPGWTVSFVSLLAMLAATEVRAGLVTFDFNSVGFFARDLAISNYMTEVYGSAVTTDGARASNERTDPGGSSNFFIATSFQLIERGDFEILFEEVPIVGMQFEGHVIDATLGDDFRVFAFSGDDEVFSFSRNDGVEIFDSEWIDFSEPVDRLIVSDSGRKDVGLDDLVVQPVPEPAAALLMLVGATLAFRRSRR